MLERVWEQKVALSVYGANYDLPNVINSTDWTLIDKLVKLLRPFEEVTREISSDDATLSLIIPFVKMLQYALRETTDEGTVHKHIPS